jgi:hypothetical protein
VLGGEPAVSSEYSANGSKLAFNTDGGFDGAAGCTDGLAGWFFGVSSVVSTHARRARLVRRVVKWRIPTRP